MNRKDLEDAVGKVVEYRTFSSRRAPRNMGVLVEVKVTGLGNFGRKSETSLVIEERSDNGQPCPPRTINWIKPVDVMLVVKENGVPVQGDAIEEYFAKRQRLHAEAVEHQRVRKEQEDADMAKALHLLKTVGITVPDYHARYGRIELPAADIVAVFDKLVAQQEQPKEQA